MCLADSVGFRVPPVPPAAASQPRDIFGTSPRVPWSVAQTIRVFCIRSQSQDSLGLRRDTGYVLWSHHARVAF